MKIKQSSSRCLLFQCRSVTYSTVICNFTSERKLNLVRSQGFLTLLKKGCRSNHVSRLFTDKIITPVTIYVYLMYIRGWKLIWTQVEVSRKRHLMGKGKLLIRKWVDFSKFSLAGMKKCGAHSHSVSNIHNIFLKGTKHCRQKFLCSNLSDCYRLISPSKHSSVVRDPTLWRGSRWSLGQNSSKRID